MELWDHVDEMRGRRPLCLRPMVVRLDPAKDHVRGGPNAWAYVAWEDGMGEKTVERCRLIAQFVGSLDWTPPQKHVCLANAQVPDAEDW